MLDYPARTRSASGASGTRSFQLRVFTKEANGKFLTLVFAKEKAPLRLIWLIDIKATDLCH